MAAMAATPMVLIAEVMESELLLMIVVYCSIEALKLAMREEAK